MGTGQYLTPLVLDAVKTYLSARIARDAARKYLAIAEDPVPQMVGFLLIAFGIGLALARVSAEVFEWSAP
jgi:hypothetical protein